MASMETITPRTTRTQPKVLADALPPGLPVERINYLIRWYQRELTASESALPYWYLEGMLQWLNLQLDQRRLGVEQ
jgi:hypothetical protein